MTTTMPHRGASHSVVRAITGKERRPEEAHCLACGAVLDFTLPDPLGLGRTVQRCTNAACPDHHPRVLSKRFLPPTASDT